MGVLFLFVVYLLPGIGYISILYLIPPYKLGGNHKIFISLCYDSKTPSPLIPPTTTTTTMNITTTTTSATEQVISSPPLFALMPHPIINKTVETELTSLNYQLIDIKPLFHRKKMAFTGSQTLKWLITRISDGSVVVKLFAM